MSARFCSSLACTSSVGPHMPSPISSERGGTWNALASRVVDALVPAGEPAPAVLDRPGDAGQAGLGQLALEGDRT